MFNNNRIIKGMQWFLILMLVSGTLGTRTVHAGELVETIEADSLRADRQQTDKSTSASLQAEGWGVPLQPSHVPSLSAEAVEAFSPLATSTAGNWLALGSNLAGTDGALSYPSAPSVYDIVVFGSDVYVAGCFTDAGGDPTADFIAKWDGTSWSGLGNDGAVTPNGALKNCVLALAVTESDIYVGGSPTLWINGVPAPQGNRIARWNGTSWSGLRGDGAGGSSLNGVVYDIAVMGNDVYVGGTFTDVKNGLTTLTEADYIARWDALTGNWSALGNNGLGNGAMQITYGGGGVQAIAIDGTNIYAGGYFDKVYNGLDLVPDATFIAKWNGTEWSALGSRGSINNPYGFGPVSSSVWAIAVSGNDVYVGGDFRDVTQNDVTLGAADYVAKWDGANWSALGSNGSGNGSLNSIVGVNILVNGSDVYVTGAFTNVNNNGTILTAADYVAKWDGTNWSALGSNGSGNGSLNTYAYALGLLGNELFVGGDFANVNNNGTVLNTADYIAAYDTSIDPNLRTISGNVSVSGAAIAYVESGSNVTQYVGSDVNGNYSVSVVSGWTGTVTPSKSGYIFAPVSRDYTNITSDQTNQDFAAQRVYVISGNAGVAGATLNYFDGTPKTVTSDSLGNYSFQIPEHWSGTVTPSKANVTFAPITRTYADVQADQLTQNYTAIITVINNNDGGLGSLRQAITDARSGATINFDPALAGQTVILTSQLDVNNSMTIDGSSLNQRISVSGNHLVRIFNIGSNSTVVLKSLILEYGMRTGTSYESYGGAVFANSYVTLTATDVDFVGNTAYQGGAVYITYTANAMIMKSRFLSNSAQSLGGAILANGGLTIKDSILTNNVSASVGGATYLDGPSTYILENNMFSDNNASSGGAISIFRHDNSIVAIRNNLFSHNVATGFYGTGGAISTAYFTSLIMTIENNTFYANQANDLGGALYLEGQSELRNNTFSENQANRSGGNAGASLYLSGAVGTKLYNNIFADNTGGGECNYYGPYIPTAGGNNLVEDGSPVCQPAITGDPMLGPLADNGGSTQTMALLPGSPAIDAGDDANCPAADQRGVARPQGSHCDIGAYEYPTISIFKSVDAHDGWILETTETSTQGGKLNNLATTLRVGDNVANKQYRSILSFDIPALPEGAIIASVRLKFKHAGVTGTNPFNTHGKLLADICEGPFKGNPALQLSDFNAKCPLNMYKAKVLTYTNAKVDNWYSQSLLPDDFQFINLEGVTQFRLRFTKDDNNDFGADFLKLFSGNAAEADRPQLVIEYYVP